MNQVSPAELEFVIFCHPKVADVRDIGVPDENCDELPKAFVVASDPSLTEEDFHKIVESGFRYIIHKVFAFHLRYFNRVCPFGEPCGL